MLVAGFILWIVTQFIFWKRSFPAFWPADLPPPPDPSWPWLAASLALALAGLFAPAAFFRPRRFEVAGRLYRALGVKAFRRIVTNGDWINRAVRRRHAGYIVHDRSVLFARSWMESIKAERAHLFYFLLALGALLYALRIGWHGWAVWHGATNLVLNLWPILLQRYTRGRILRVAPQTAANALAAPRGRATQSG